MTISKNKLYIFVASIVIVLLVIFGFLISGSGRIEEIKGKATTNEIDESGKQIIDVTVKGGYFPKRIEAKAGVPTTLRMNSNGAFGCERALGIAKLGISKTLPTDGVTEFDLDSQEAGTSLTGSCSMGMYTFKINFI